MSRKMPGATLKTLLTVSLAVAAVGGGLGVFYSGFSTADFVEHLDRQEHGLNCSLLPGLTESSQLDAAQMGCKTAMLSPYSSFWRTRFWGGIPYSLLAMGLFGFAAILAISAIAGRRGHSLAWTLVLILAGLVAVVTSIVFFTIAKTRLHAVCTTCVGTYISSAILLLGAGASFFFARSYRLSEDVEHEPVRVLGALVSILVLLAEMGLAVFVPVAVYAGAVPQKVFEQKIGSCEKLKTTQGADMLTIGAAGGPEAIMVIDPLCPQCADLHRRLAESPIGRTLSYKVFLLPLDAECLDWLIKDSMHPGACLLSRALVCAGSQGADMLDYIFDNQEELRQFGRGKQFDKLRQTVLDKFPAVKDCMDSQATRKKLYDGIQRFGIANSLKIETPQLFIHGRRLCSEDSDLGLEYALTHLLGGDQAH